MWFGGRTVPHDGTRPAAPLTTQFDFPCGREFYETSCRQAPCFRSSCAPPNFQEYWWSTVGYYSPAICPGGYTVGCSRWDSRQGPKVEKTEEAMMCVPRGYTCDTDNPSFASSATVKAPMIQIRWAESDLPSLETHPMLPGMPAWQTPGSDQPWEDLKGRALSYSDSGDGGVPSTSTASTASSPTNISPADGGGPAGGTAGRSGGLSDGAKIGLGVGISVGVLCLLSMGGFLIWWIRKNRLRSVQGGANPPTAYHSAMPPGHPIHPEIDGQENKLAAGGGDVLGDVPSVARPPAAVVRELDTVRSESYPSELSGQHRSYEIGTAPRPTPELAAYPYSPGTPVEAQQYMSNEPYAPYLQQQGMQMVAQSVSPQSYGAYSHPQPATQAYHTYSPAQTTATAVDTNSAASYPSQQPPAIDTTGWQHAAPAEAGQPVTAAAPISTGTNTAEYSRLREEHAQLEQQRQTLLQLQQIEQQQAALRERMAAAQAGRQAEGPAPGSGGG